MIVRYVRNIHCNEDNDQGFCGTAGTLLRPNFLYVPPDLTFSNSAFCGFRISLRTNSDYFPKQH
jgi:hypothetical protein